MSQLPAPSPAPAWRPDELADPHSHPEKAAKVREMFAAIAPAYDLNNRVHSAWLDQAWRRLAVRAAKVKPGDRVLDVACGTGDLTIAFARSQASTVAGLDFTPAMLELAREKRRNLPSAVSDKMSFTEGDAHALPFGDASFDVVSIAFGIRNVVDPERALAEFFRVLRPGGRLVILEFDRPSLAPVRWFNSLWSGVIMPRSATLIAGDKSGAYMYLPKSVGSFMSRSEMLACLRRQGFADVSARSLTLGVCACYRAVRPA